MTKKKKQHTYRIYGNIHKDGSGIAVDVISRKSGSRPFDCMSVWISDGTKKNTFSMIMSPDEAIEVAAGLNCAVDFWLSRWGPYQRFRRRGSKNKNWMGSVTEVE